MFAIFIMIGLIIAIGLSAIIIDDIEKEKERKKNNDWE